MKPILWIYWNSINIITSYFNSKITSQCHCYNPVRNFVKIVILSCWKYSETRLSINNNNNNNNNNTATIMKIGTKISVTLTTITNNNYYHFLLIFVMFIITQKISFWFNSIVKLYCFVRCSRFNFFKVNQYPYICTCVCTFVRI